MKFGRRAPVHTRRTFRLGLAVHRALASLGTPPAVSNDYVSAVMKASPGGWGMYLNNQLGDCVCADSAHQLMLHTANSGSIIIPTDQDVLSLYEAVGGYEPANPSTDQGCDEQSMERYMIATGLCGHKSAATGPIDPTNADHLRWAVQIFGAARLGILVTDAMMEAFSAGRPWESATGSVEGGHDVPIVKYDADYAYVVTWGKLQPMTWQLVTNPQCTQEAHCSVWPDFVKAGGTSPAGFDLSTMLADAQAIEMQEAA